METSDPTSTRRAFLSATAAMGAAALDPSAGDDPVALGHDDQPGRPIRPQRPEPELRELLKEIDPRQLGRFVKNVADNEHTRMRIRVIWRRDRYLRGSDHVSFVQQGYPAARFTEPRENFNHEHQDTRIENGIQFGDLPEFCDFGYVARVAKVNAATLWSLALGPGTPKNLKIVTSALTNTTTLRWDAAADPDLAGYEVVWRETTAPDWTYAIDVGDVVTATVDLSKDNVQFGLRAVDRAGRRSPVAFPVPVS